eukprot:6214013-Pleurochrysis_carterae.AAC.3
MRRSTTAQAHAHERSGAHTKCAELQNMKACIIRLKQRFARLRMTNSRSLDHLTCGWIEQERK